MLAFRVWLACAVLIRLALSPVSASALANVVGTGTAGSCTEAAFDAVFYAVQTTGGTITFNCGAAPVTILFSAQKQVSANTVLEGGGKITLSGANAVGLFQVFNGKTLTLNQITLTRALGSGGAVENFGTLNVNSSQVTNNTSIDNGGGIASHGTLNVNNTTFSGNSAAGYGGGIFSDSGQAAVTNSVFSANSAVSGGGGMAVANGASAAITNSQFSGNQATDTFAQGGAVVNRESAATTIAGSTFHQNRSSRGGAISLESGALSVSQSTITGNWGAYGGGIRQEAGTLTVSKVKLEGNGYSPTGSKVNTGGGGLSWGNGTATLTDVTITGNWASYGGGFDHANGTTSLTNVTISGNQAVGAGGFDTNGGTVNLTNVTIAYNAAGFFGGGIGNRGGALTLKNVLLAGNVNSSTAANWNCYASIGSTPFNLSSDFTCGLGAGRDNTNPNLRPLESVNTYTRVHRVFAGSPALDTGTGVGCPAADQRGTIRPQGTACDIGAVEMTPAELAEPNLMNRLYISYV